MELQKEILGLSIAYALLAVLLLVIALRARIPWPFKAAAAIVTSAFYCVAFFRIEGLSGWSTPTPLPSQFQLLWARVVEPDPFDREPGAVHIWIEQLDAANLPSGQPRAHRLPYSAALAHKVPDAVIAAYKRTNFFEMRKKMMDDWATFATSDPAKNVDNVVALRAAQ